MPYPPIGDPDQEHGGPNQAAPIVYEHCRPNRPAPTVHSRLVGVLPHHKSQDVLYHDLRSTQEGVHYRPQRTNNPKGNLTHNHITRQFVWAMIAAMSTRTHADLIKLNQTQNQTQKTMTFQMTTLHQGLVAAHKLQTDDKQTPMFRLCEFRPPLDRQGQRQSGAP